MLTAARANSDGPIEAAAANGWLDERKAALEAHIAIKRAGADFIITYYALELARWLDNGK